MRHRIAFCLAAVVTSAALALGSTPASAAFATGSRCADHAPGAHPDGLSVNDMTLNSVAANDCFGLVTIGGDVHNHVADINAIGWGSFNNVDWIKDDVSGGVTKTFLGMTWTLSADNGASSSTYTLTVADADPGNPPSLPFVVDIVGFLKAGPPGAFYFFDDRTIDTTNSGTFQIVWTVGAGNNPGLSGLTLFIRGGTDDPCPPGSTDPACFNIEAPEPGSLALLGLAVLALAALRRVRPV